MELHEYYVKEIFRQAGLPVLAGGVAYTPREAKAVADIVSSRDSDIKHKTSFIREMTAEAEMLCDAKSNAFVGTCYENYFFHFFGKLFF